MAGGQSGPMEMQVQMPGMQAGSRMKTTPVPVQRTRRHLPLRLLTSLPAGKMCPLMAFPLLREDRLLSTRIVVNADLMETAELLVNAVNFRVMAYLVPYLAMEHRFNGIDQLNRSYQGQPETTGGVVQPFFSTKAMEAYGTNPIFKVMGKHARPGTMVNQGYVEAYNMIWNFRARNRSPDIVVRTPSDNSLAKAFWLHQSFADILPDFDQAAVDGEVPLNFAKGYIPIYGIGMADGTSLKPTLTAANYRRSDGTTQTVKGWKIGEAQAGTNDTGNLMVAEDTAKIGWPAIRAELDQAGASISLANIELATKTQAFARLRKQYTGHTDPYIIDLLMAGITVPEQEWRQPMLLADRTTIFGMSKRYSTDSTDLTASAVNGQTFIDMTIRTPRCPTGGIVMVVAEFMPEQLFERQQDPFMFVTNTTTHLPEFLRDTLDPEKVEVVENQYVDVDHTTPTGTFGYRPLNSKWNKLGPHVGGKFYRPVANAPTDEDRQRIWAVETLNPTLAEDFYLCSNMHTKPFVVTNQDPVECVLRGEAMIEGNTVFGALLVEAGDDYTEILAKAPMDRIQNPGVLVAETDETVVEEKK